MWTSKKWVVCLACLLLSGVGCGYAQTTDSSLGAPTYYGAVRTLILAKCASCHHPGAPGPFSLLTYEDAAKRGPFIRSVVQRHYMPPWKADPHYVSFSNERLLTDQEIQLISDWVAAGMPKGKAPATTPKAAVVTGTMLNRPPDIRLDMAAPFTVPGDNTDHFIVFKIPISLAKGTSPNIAAIEFTCNNRKLVHHANYGFYSVAPGADLHAGKDHVDLGDSSDQFYAFDTLSKKMIYYSGWIPGTSFESYPTGMGWTMPARGVLFLYVHFAPSATAESFTGGVQLFTTSAPILRPVQAINIGSGGLGAISPPLLLSPQTVSTFTATILTKNDQSLLYVWPHMHLLGKSYRAYAVTPAGDTLPLIRIPAWDFNWQELYRFRKPLHIPGGSTIFVEGTYDNTDANPRNPNSPPRLVFSDKDGLMKTADEMLNLLLIYVPYQKGDENIDLQKTSY